MTCGIYQIVHVASGKRYIGQSHKVEKRLEGHRKMLDKAQHHSKYLQRAWDKYGASSFSFELVEVCRLEELDEREQWWIDNSDSAFNVCKFASSLRGLEITHETRAKISVAMKGRIVTDETKRRQSIASKGKKKTEAHCRKISQAKKGRKPKLTEESRDRISESLRARWLSQEYRDRMYTLRTGRKRTEETKAKMSISNKAAWIKRRQKQKQEQAG